MGKRIEKMGGLENPFEKGGRSVDDTPNEDAPDFRTNATHEELFGVFSKHDINKPANQKHFNIGYEKIRRITPDRVQPRRVVPLSVRGGQPVTFETLPGIFERWLDAVNAERETPFPLDKHLTAAINDRSDQVMDEYDAEVDGKATPDQPDEEPQNPIEAAFLRVVELAASIRQRGLLNPITVAPTKDGTGFVIETGERRWVAYNLLHWHFGEDDENERGDLKWDRIPVVQVDKPDVWRQAVENNARDNLNAVGKARQLALLMMHIHGQSNFTGFDAFEHEMAFYAQVADGNEYRIPRGWSEDLAAALNLSSPKQIRDYRRILKIPAELWDRADEENWTEGRIRSELAAYKRGTENGKKPTRTTDSAPNGTVDRDLKPVYKLQDFYSPKRLEKMPPEKRKEVITSLDVLLKQLKQMDRDITKREAK